MSNPTTTLTVERKSQAAGGIVGPTIAITPAIDEDYWSYRVALSPVQAVLGFPWFSTFGIGFAVEEGWNTNLPWTCEAADIAERIAHNKGDDSISDGDVLRAIELIQEAIKQDQEAAS